MSPARTPAPPPPTLPPHTPRLLVFLLFVSFIICNIDRINLSIAIIPLSAQFHYPPSIQGKIHAAFFLGYMATQIPAGLLSDRLSPLPILPLGVLVWSLCTFFTPLCASLNLPALLLVRIIMGLGEGLAMPSMNAIVAAYVPHHARSSALSFIYSGMYMGSILGLATAPFIISAFQWQALFYIFGACGVLWLAVFHLSTASLRPLPAAHRSHPSNPVHTSADKPHEPDETQYMLPVSEAGAGESRVAPSVSEMLRRPCVVAIVVAHFCCTWGYFVLLTWLPTFLYSRFELQLAQSSFLSALPWVAMFVASNVSGAVADAMIRRGVDVTLTRKLMQTVGFLGPALFLGLVTHAENAYAAMGLVSVALALAAFSNSGVYATHQDIGPLVAGTLLGISNTFASLPGVVGVYVTGVVLERTGGDWNVVFGMAIAFYLLGWVVYVGLATSKRQW
eukprot:GFKZ01000687.1.p1 GENE.GFKZ01000687.1~~GFKZ01000687.1.p1  ORF type:complete len:458 (-),score=35.84 GFKZ01000687.1:477-1823(-)